MMGLSGVCSSGSVGLSPYRLPLSLAGDMGRGKGGQDGAGEPFVGFGALFADKQDSSRRADSALPFLSPAAAGGFPGPHPLPKEVGPIYIPPIQATVIMVSVGGCLRSEAAWAAGRGWAGCPGWEGWGQPAPALQAAVEAGSRGESVNSGAE